MNGLDRHITGNYGEDSVGPDELSTDQLVKGTVIDVSPETGGNCVNATVIGVAEAGDLDLIVTEEYGFPFAVPRGSVIPLGDDL